MADRNHEFRAGRIFRIALVAWVSPVLAGLMELLMWPVGPRRWRERVLTLSVLGNILFLVVLVIGYVESANDHTRVDEATGILVAPECEQCGQQVMQLCLPLPESDLDDVFRNTIFVACGGLASARFEFQDDTMDAIREVTIMDRLGRPWIDANIIDGSLIYTRYSGDSTDEGVQSLLDKTHDGIPDVLIDWDGKKKLVPQAPIEWVESKESG